MGVKTRRDGPIRLMEILTSLLVEQRRSFYVYFGVTFTYSEHHKSTGYSAYSYALAGLSGYSPPWWNCLHCFSQMTSGVCVVAAAALRPVPSCRHSRHKSIPSIPA